MAGKTYPDIEKRQKVFINPSDNMHGKFRALFEELLYFKILRAVVCMLILKFTHLFHKGHNICRQHDVDFPFALALHFTHIITLH